MSDSHSLLSPAETEIRIANCDREIQAANAYGCQCGLTLIELQMAGLWLLDWESERDRLLLLWHSLGANAIPATHPLHQKAAFIRAGADNALADSASVSAPYQPTNPEDF